MSTPRMLLVVLNVAGIAACGGGDGTEAQPEGAHIAAASDEFFVQDNGRRLATPQPAVINLSFYAPNRVETELSFQLDEQEISRFSLVAWVPYELLRSREFEVDLVGRPLVEGDAAANMFIGTEVITTGKMLIKLEEGERLSATVAERNLEFYGRFALGCFVPADSLNSGVSAPVPTVPGSLPALVGDSLFESPQCAEAKQAIN